ncbi:MAG: MerR family transcriptional regulator [Planctomycetota bacterium]|jgi:DNA-binding transcriptional MerR regulator
MNVAMTIKELAERVNLTARTIRYYEQIGLLNGIVRDQYNRRRYNEGDVYILILVQRAKHLLGLSLEEIKELLVHLLEDPTEKKVIRRSIEMLRTQVKKVETKQQELRDTRSILIKEIDRLESLLEKREGSGFTANVSQQP